jgi:hypothetical protein
VNEYKINFYRLIQVPVIDAMVPGERSKSAVIRNQKDLLNLFLRLHNLPYNNETAFLQPLTVFVSLGKFAKKLRNFNLKK